MPPPYQQSNASLHVWKEMGKRRRRRGKGGVGYWGVARRVQGTKGHDGSIDAQLMIEPGPLANHGRTRRSPTRRTYRPPRAAHLDGAACGGGLFPGLVEAHDAHHAVVRVSGQDDGIQGWWCFGVCTDSPGPPFCSQYKTNHRRVLIDDYWGLWQWSTVRGLALGLGRVHQPDRPTCPSITPHRPTTNNRS